MLPGFGKLHVDHGACRPSLDVAASELYCTLLSPKSACGGLPFGVSLGRVITAVTGLPPPKCPLSQGPVRVELSPEPPSKQYPGAASVPSPSPTGVHRESIRAELCVFSSCCFALHSSCSVLLVVRGLLPIPHRQLESMYIRLHTGSHQRRRSLVGTMTSGPSQFTRKPGIEPSSVR